MPAASDQLVQLLRALQPSLAMYLADSGIWTYPGPEEIRLALAELVADQRAVMDRATLILEEREVPIPKKAYPISFSGWHDVDLRHVLPRVVAGLEAQRPVLERIATASDDAVAAGLAAEALKAARQHVDALHRIAGRFAPRSAASPAPGSAGSPSSATSAAS